MNGRNTGTSRAVGCVGAALGPVEQLGERRLEAVPHLLDRFDFEPEGVGQRLLGEPRIDPDAKRAGRQLEQREAARCIEMVEHRRQRLRRIEPRRRAQPLDRVGDADRRVIDLRRLARRLGPQQRDRLGHVADIVAAHVQQHRVDPLFGDGADRRALDCRDVERAGQRRKAVAAVGVGRFLEIIADQLELGIARARVDEIVEQLRKGAHRASNARTALGCQCRRTASAARIVVQSLVGRLSSASSTCSRQDCIATRWPGQQRKLRRAAGQALERGEAVCGGELADRVHPGVKIERRKARPGVADFGDAQPDLVPHVRERIGSH